ncbi:hypothetical protein OSTOST_10457 [Ostertagia ostertagi]
MEARRWEYMSHGYFNTRYHWGYEEQEEREVIEHSKATHLRLTGRKLRGWFSPAVSNTLNTPDLVKEAGLDYFCDFYHDDQPTPLATKHGPADPRPLLDGPQRRDDLPPAGRGGGIRPDDHRPFRHGLSRGRRERPRHVPGAASLHDGRAAPAEASRSRAVLHPQAQGCLGLHRRGNPRLVCRQRAETLPAASRKGRLT